MINETLIPHIGVVTDIRIDTPDVKTFRVVTPDGKKLFEHMPGQCAMLSIPGVGEAMFSITSSPTNEEYMEFSIKKCGCLTDWLHSMEVGQEITIRGPYGNHSRWRRPLRARICSSSPAVSVLLRCAPSSTMSATTERTTAQSTLYTARAARTTLLTTRDTRRMDERPDVEVYLTIDREQEGWDGHVGFVPNYVKELGFDPDKTASVRTSDHD